MAKFNSKNRFSKANSKTALAEGVDLPMRITSFRGALGIGFERPACTQLRRRVFQADNRLGR